VIQVIESCTTISNAQKLTSLSWDTTNSIMTRSVKRGLKQRKLDDIEYVGVDEKQFRAGHDYISCLNDLSKGRVLDVVEGRKKEDAEELLEKIPEQQRPKIKAVAMDKEKWFEFSTLKDKDLKTSRAWAIKENFRWFWDYTYTERAKNFFYGWYNWAIRSQLTPVKKVAKLLKKHFCNIITYFKHRITNTVSEGLNSRIQTVKSAARGFHSFKNFRIRILFFCGKLDLYPEISH